MTMEITRRRLGMTTAAAAALGSGIVVAAASYTALGLLGAALIALPAAAMLRGRAALRRS